MAGPKRSFSGAPWEAEVGDCRALRAGDRVHREAFGTHPPATTMVEVARLIHPDMLIEIEADAVVSG
ncbi:MAG: Rid family hydrolase [Gemmatimonadota bacterium]|nr:Rid family hydrolase [Gemmatimonadota bacterium]